MKTGKCQTIVRKIFGLSGINDVILQPKMNLNDIINMKQMKLWRLAFAMLAAFSLASCSSDDDEVFQMDQLSGTWQRVYDKGVVTEGYVQYTFTPGTPTNVGVCTVHVSDVFAGDTTFVRDYALTEDHYLAIYTGQYGGTPLELQEYDVRRLSTTDMAWQPVGSDVVLNFKKVK